MFRAALVLVALIGAVAASRMRFDQTLNSPWQAYKAKHGRNYDERADQDRRNIWEQTVQKINQHNLNADLGLTTYRMGLNKFTDMTNDEFRAYKGLRFNATAMPRRGHPLLLAATTDLPKSVDWRTEGYVTPVKDQARCGSCWTFSATGALEGQHFRATNKLVSLSEQQLVDCATYAYGNQGCSGGLMDGAFDYVKDFGIVSEKSYPYTARQGLCKFYKRNVAATARGFNDIEQGSETALQQAIANNGPVSVAIDAGHDSFQLYNSGVYDEPACSSQELDHGVLAVGYGTTTDGVDYWIVKNSWGEVWGQDGYILMSRNKNNQCGIATMASFPVV